MSPKKYLYSLRFFIILSLVIFCLAVIYGYWSARNLPQEAIGLMEEFGRIYKPILEARPIVQSLLIFLNNALTVFLTIILAVVFGIFPFLVVFSNGLILGAFFFLWQQEMPWLIFFKGLLPHGLVEIPILIVASAIGLKIGQLAFKKTFQKQGQIKPEISQALKFFLQIFLPLLALAALLEIFITPWLLNDGI